MSKHKTYDSVSEMVLDLGGKKFYQQFLKYIGNRRVVRTLIIMRAKVGLTDDAKFAKKMGITIAKLNKIESLRDDEITIKDLRTYIQALGNKYE